MLLSEIERELAPGAAYLVAVSGGIDSMVLLHAVASLRSELNLKLEVAHVDHGLRPDSDLDAELVERFCRSHELVFHLQNLSRCPDGENLEQWARRARYDFFESCLEERSLDRVLVAHHRDDHLETFLMRLITNKETTSIQKENHRFELFVR